MTVEIHPFLTLVLLVPFQRHLSNPLYSSLLVNVAFLTSFLQRHARILLPAVILTSLVLTTVLFLMMRQTVVMMMIFSGINRDLM
jgi:hypothetical protein